MWCSSTLCRMAQTLSSLFPARRCIRLLFLLPVLPSVEAYSVSAAGHVLRAHPTTSPSSSETPNGICHVCLRGRRSAAPHFYHPRGPSAVLELSKTGATWSRDGCKKMGEACLATSTPKRTEIEPISKQSRGEGGRGEKAAIPTRTRRLFPIVCADFCYLSKHTESQVHTSRRKRHELTGTGRPAGTTQKNLSSGRHLAKY